jgi:hypothetical protein
MPGYRLDNIIAGSRSLATLLRAEDKRSGASQHMCRTPDNAAESQIGSSLHLL